MSLAQIVEKYSKPIQEGSSSSSNSSSSSSSNSSGSSSSSSSSSGSSSSDSGSTFSMPSLTEEDNDLMNYMDSVSKSSSSSSKTEGEESSSTNGGSINEGADAYSTRMSILAILKDNGVEKSVIDEVDKKIAKDYAMVLREAQKQDTLKSINSLIHFVSQYNAMT
jgi:hypothetical protein